MSTPHVPLDPEVALPDQFAHVQGYLLYADPDLRIRRSVERPDLYVLERRHRRAPAVNTGMAIRTDVHLQARDGYIHIASVHPSYLTRPWRIVEELKDGGVDIWEAGGAERVADELEDEENFLRETRRRRRLSMYLDIAREAYDVLDRMGNKDGTERTRFNNPGLN